MYVKFSPEDLNPNPYLPRPISTYTYGVIITSRVYSGKILSYINDWPKLVKIY